MPPPQASPSDVVCDDRGQSPPTVAYGSGDQLITILSGAYSQIGAGSGDDDFVMLGGTVRGLSGQDGNDSFRIRAGSVSTMVGGVGNDSFVLDGGAVRVVSAGPGDDVVYMNRGDDPRIVTSILGGDGNDRVFLSTSVVGNISGQEGSADELILVGRDTLQGQSVDTIELLTVQKGADWEYVNDRSGQQKPFDGTVKIEQGGTLEVVRNSRLLASEYLIEGGGTLTTNGTATFDGSTAEPFVVEGTLGGIGTVVSANGRPVVVKSTGRVAPLTPLVPLTIDGPITFEAGSTLAIDAREAVGSGLSAERLNVTGPADFAGGSFVDVTFDVNAQLPALEGITILAADGGLSGFAPAVVLDPGSLPGNQNFHLDLEATNLGGTFAGPGQPIPVGAGGEGLLVLQVVNDDPRYTNPPQITVLNAPYQVPSAQPVLAPQRVPQLIQQTPTAQPYLAPALVKGPTSNVTTPITPTKGGKTGTKVSGGGGVQLGGGTLTPQPQTTGGTPTSPNNIPIGTTTPVVVVDPPDVGTTDFISVSGSYGTVDQKHAGPGSAFRLIYSPHRVDVAYTPKSYGKAVDQLLPEPHARATTDGQSLLVSSLYPLPQDQIDNALDELKGVDADPTFVTVMNSRIVQEAIDQRLAARRSGLSFPVEVTQGAVPSGSDTAWGQVVGRYVDDDDYLGGSDLRSGGFVVGTDHQFDNGVLGGIAFGYVNTDIDAESGDSNVSSAEIAAYASRQFAGGWFVNGNLGFGYHWIDAGRDIAFAGYSVEGSTEARSFFTGVNVGKSIPTSFGMVEPVAGLRYEHVSRDGYEEDGYDEFARDVDDVTVDAIQALLGVTFIGNSFEAGNVEMRPEVRIGYVSDLGDTDITDGVNFLAAPDMGFDVVTPGPDGDAAVLGLRLVGKSGARSEFFVDYQADIGSSAVGQALRAGFTYTF